MLDLAQPPRTISGVDLAADHDDPLTSYVLPGSPTPVNVDGRPQVTLLRFVRDGVLSGGHLHLLLELAHPAGAIEAARAALSEERRGEVVAMRAPPMVTAEAELSFLGRETDADGGLTPLIRREFGRTAAGQDPPYSVAFSVSLTPDGVELMEAALRAGGAPIGVVFRLGVEGLWPAQRVVASVDWSRVYDHFSVHYKEGDLLVTDDVQRLAERLVEDRVVTVQVVEGLSDDGPAGEGGEPATDPGPALAWVQRELVERFCEPTMALSRRPAHASLGTVGEIFGVGSSFAVKRLTQVEQARAHVDFQQARVVTRTLTVQAHLADLLGGSPVEHHVEDAPPDHPFFQRFGLTVRSATPLAAVHVQEVVARLSYGTFQHAFRLTPDLLEESVETWADASPDGTWTLQPDVTFAPDAPVDPGFRVVLPAVSGRGREVALDLEDLLGLTRIQVEGSTDPRVLMSAVRLEDVRGEEVRAERELGLTPDAPVQTSWFRDHRPGDRITAAVRHLLTDGRAVEGPEFEVDTRVLRLPPAFPGALTVQLIGDADWAGLDRVIVALQKGEDQATGTVVFDAPGQVRAVNLDMPDPTDRTFRYRMVRTWSSGLTEEDPWVTTDVAVVLVGRFAANLLTVELVPVGPELPQAGVALIEVELAYVDPEHQVRDIRTAVFRAKADRFRWEVPLADTNRRAYEYRITTHRVSGEKSVGSWTTAAERILPIPVVAA